MIIRTYQCNTCGETFEVTCESNDPDPPCPYCDKVLQWRPQRFAITGVKSKAIDVAQDILENDYGLTNFRDNNREGDVGAIMPVESRADREAKEALERAVAQETELARAQGGPPQSPQLANAVQGFWGGVMGGSVSPGVVNAAIAGAKTGPATGVNPMRMLHDAGKRGLLPTNFRIIGRA